jgi:hypothetical protein
LLFKAGNIEVYYYIDHDVGGSTFGQAVWLFLNLQPTGEVLEWCSVPWLIGFKLFDSYELSSLTLNDINPELIENYQRTISKE